jgi:hypothetical protein
MDATIILSIVVIALVVERFFFARHMTQELSKCIKAIMSRNINEYIAATSVDKAPKQAFIENDQVDLDVASDEDFDKFIKSQTK